MKILKSLAILIFASAMLVACGGSGGSDPKSVAEAFTKAQMSYDFDAAKKHCTKEMAATMEQGQKAMENMPADQLKALKDMTKDMKVEVGEAKISEDGNTATVDLKITVMGQETSAPCKLVKEDGNWKVSM